MMVVGIITIMGQPGQDVFDQIAEVHQVALPIIWLVATTLSIFLVMYRHRKGYVILHSILGTLITLATLCLTLPMLAIQGIQLQPNPNHTRFGIFIVSFTILLLVAGWITRITQLSSVTPPSSLRYIRIVHSLFGYFLWICCFFQILLTYNGVILGLIILEGLILVFAVIFRKLRFPTLEGSLFPPVSQRPPTVMDANQLSSLNPDFVIFANLAYDFRELQKVHPAGSRILEGMRQREVDRFLFGMYSSETHPEIPPHSHSFNALNLIGEPIGRLNIVSPFSNFDTLRSEFTVAYREGLNIRNDLFAVFLRPKTPKVLGTYQGYTKVEQLGRCYSLTLDGNVTRLYTAVNFLLKDNINHLQRKFPVLRGRSPSFVDKKKFTEIGAPQRELTEVVSMSKDEVEGGPLLPLMIKRYPKGKLTPSLFGEEYHTLEVSSERGRGLQLGNTKPGLILVVVGGTGIFPICDLIDLLYKAVLLEHTPVREFEERDPILKDKPFTGFTWEFYASFQSAEDLPAATLCQLIALSEDPRFKVTLKMGGKKPDAVGKVLFTEERFEKTLRKQLTGNESRIWVCGPPRMNESMVALRTELGFPENLFLII